MARYNSLNHAAGYVILIIASLAAVSLCAGALAAADGSSADDSGMYCNDFSWKYT